MSRLLRGLAAVMMMSAGSAAAQSGDPVGTWLNADRDGIVQIGDCREVGHGTAGTLCGVVVWIRDAVDRTTGRAPVDGKNADPALRARPIMGLPVLTELRRSAPNRWDGKVYNIDDGKTYSGKLILTSDNALRVEGCVMLMCQGETWTRQPAGAPGGRAAPRQDRAR